MAREGRLADGIRARLTKGEGRRFGLQVGLAFLALAGLLWWRERLTAAVAVAALGTLLVLGGITIPDRLGPVYAAWMRLAQLLSRITTPAFMGLVYFAVLMPVGLVMRAVGRNPLRKQPSASSFWVDREAGHRRGDLERQF